jgi:hypothetical protein
MHPAGKPSSETEMIAAAWSTPARTIARQRSGLPQGAVSALPPGGVEAIVAGRPALYTLVLGSVLASTAAVVAFELPIEQSWTLLLLLLFGGLAWSPVRNRENWHRFTGEVVPGSAVVDVAWNAGMGAAALAVAAGGDSGRAVGGGALACAGAFLMWRAGQGLEPLAPAPLRFRSPATVQVRGFLVALLGGLVALSTVVEVSALWFQVPCLVIVVFAVQRRRASLANGADVPRDPRLATPLWFTLASAGSMVVFTIVALETDAAL